MGDEERLEQAIKNFIELNGRLPSLEEEACLWEQINSPELYESYIEKDAG